MPHIMIFDIETCHNKPLMDLYGYKPKKEDDFPPNIYHLPCAIAIGEVDGDGILQTVTSLCHNQGFMSDDPSLLTQAFWEKAEHTAILVSFNGRNFDIPVLELCALHYGIAAPKHWKPGTFGNRYRFGTSHLDLLEVLGNYGTSTKALSLAHLVQFLGYVGKDGMDGSLVQTFYDAGRLEEIQAYNRLDVIRTYAVWLQWARIAGRLTEPHYHVALKASKPFLDQIRREPDHGQH